MSRITSGALLATLLLLLAAAPARAQEVDTDLLERTDYSSPRHFAFEVKVGPYAPDIDSEFGDGGPTPYGDLFDGNLGLMVRWEVDWQFWQGFGSLGVGAVAGFFTQSTETFLDKNSGPNKPASAAGGGLPARSAGKTRITLVPVALLLVYRFDWLNERFGVPLVPFVKGGVNYTFWWIYKGDGKLATLGGEDAKGGTWGWQVNAGLSLLLDVVEPAAAKNLDVELGINHTYLFFEFTHIQADGFGAGDKLRVGDTTWQGGLAFEF